MFVHLYLKLSGQGELYFNVLLFNTHKNDLVWELS
jgi:hypothetical protein